MTAIIQTEQLTKSYGPFRGIVDVDLEVNEGEIFGFLGPNGAGKTTTIRILLDLIRPTSGAATVFGIETTRRSGRDPPPPRLPARRVEPLRPAHRRRDDHLLREPPRRRRPGLRRPSSSSASTSTRAARFREYSKGNKQKVGLIVRAPAPAGAADPRRAHVGPRPARPADVQRARSFEARAEGRTVFLSSHIISEVERTCDRVAIIREGRIVRLDTRRGRPRPGRPRGRAALRRAVAAAAFAGDPGRRQPRRGGPHAPDARHRPDRAGRPARRPVRPRRLRQPRAVPRGGLPRRVRPRRRPAGGRRASPGAPRDER